jgi:hypothetical protein
MTGAAQQAVHKSAHEGRVEAVLRLEAGQASIGNSLGTRNL